MRTESSCSRMHVMNHNWSVIRRLQSG